MSPMAQKQWHSNNDNEREQWGVIAVVQGNTNDTATVIVIDNNAQQRQLRTSCVLPTGLRMVLTMPSTPRFTNVATCAKSVFPIGTNAVELQPCVRWEIPDDAPDRGEVKLARVEVAPAMPDSRVKALLLAHFLDLLEGFVQHMTNQIGIIWHMGMHNVQNQDVTMKQRPDELQLARGATKIGACAFAHTISGLRTSGAGQSLGKSHLRHEAPCTTFEQRHH